MNKLLIANRGEIARRILRTAQRMGIATVAVYSDADAQALHVREAGQAVALGGNASADTYLRIDKLLAAARATGADAVHPGYGFLSENAEFAQAVVDAGLTCVGPPPAAIRALGSKSNAKALARERGVPCLPGYEGADQSDERLMAEAQRIGLPLMVKAAAGGGGRGMRLVTELAQLPAAVHSARSESLAAFGSGELLLERALLAPRHVEVQVFADAHGHCIHLGERDCSVQRRHQKIIEETPSPAVDAALRERMGRCAVELAQAAGYVGAGTVEFLVEAGAFYLMEMNTRLQVEHPVTEMVTGLDLVEWQLRIARGEPLPLTQDQVQFQGHAIEVRLCAEDENFTPHTGTVRHFKAPHGARFDHAIYQGLQVSPWYDSMLGKLIVHAPTRSDAIAQLARALDELQLLGLPTNRALLAACLRHARFQSGQALIPFLAEEGDAIRKVLQKSELESAAQCWHSGVLASKLGWQGGESRLPCPFPRPARFLHRGVVREALEQGPVPVDASTVAVRVPSPTGIVQWHVQRQGVDLWLQDASFDPPASSAATTAGNALLAPFNGKVIAVHAAAGAPVRKGDTLVVLESMKLEHALAAPRDGVVATVLVQPGQQAAPGQTLLQLEPLP